MNAKIARVRMILLLFILAALFCKNKDDFMLLLPDTGSGKRPRVINSSPSVSTPSVATNTQIFLDFNVPMNEEKTKRAFSLTGSVPAIGRPRWVAGQRLYYDLEEPLTSGESFVLKLSATALSDAGLSMDVEYIVHFIAGSRIDAPQVIATTPGDNEQSVDPDTIIRFIFSRPMDRNSVQNAFSITPALSGDFNWDSYNTTLTFAPSVSLNYPTTYSVNLSTGAKDLEGIKLSSPFTLTFQVGTDFQPPEITSVSEQGNPLPMTDSVTGIYKESGFVVRFSEAMDYSAVESNFSLIRLVDGSAASGIFLWNILFTHFTFVPDEPLEPENDYRLQIGTGAGDVSGNSLTAPYYLHFRVDNSAGAMNSEYLRILRIKKILPAPTAEDLCLDRAFCPDPDLLSLLSVNGSSGANGGTMSLEITFSHSLDPGSVPANLYHSRILGTAVAQGEIIGVSFDSSNGLTKNILIIDYDSMGINHYKLELSGGRNGIKSTAENGESETWLAETGNVFYEITE